MPAFGKAEQRSLPILPAQQIALLADWLRGEWYRRRSPENRSHVPSVVCLLRGGKRFVACAFKAFKALSASIPRSVCLGRPIPEPSCPSVKENKPVVLSKKISFRIHFFQTNLRQFDAKEFSLALHECHDLMPCHEISNVIRITFPILNILGLRRLFFN